MYGGRTQRKKDRLAKAITEDIVKILTIKKEEVIIVFQEVSQRISFHREFVYKYNYIFVSHHLLENRRYRIIKQQE